MNCKISNATNMILLLLLWAALQSFFHFIAHLYKYFVHFICDFFFDWAAQRTYSQQYFVGTQRTEEEWVSSIHLDSKSNISSFRNEERCALATFSSINTKQQCSETEDIGGCSLLYHLCCLLLCVYLNDTNVYLSVFHISLFRCSCLSKGRWQKMWILYYK